MPCRRRGTVRHLGQTSHAHNCCMSACLHACLPFGGKPACVLTGALLRWRLQGEDGRLQGLCAATRHGSWGGHVGAGGVCGCVGGCVCWGVGVGESGRRSECMGSNAMRCRPTTKGQRCVCLLSQRLAKCCVCGQPQYDLAHSVKTCRPQPGCARLAPRPAPYLPAPPRLPPCHLGPHAGADQRHVAADLGRDHMQPAARAGAVHH